MAWRNSDGRILTTSQYSPAARLSNILGVELTTIMVSAMDDHEIQRLLSVAGAPSHVNSQETIGLLSGITGGHPTLIAAAVQWYS